MLASERNGGNHSKGNGCRKRNDEPKRAQETLRYFGRKEVARGQNLGPAVNPAGGGNSQESTRWGNGPRGTDYTLIPRHQRKRRLAESRMSTSSSDLHVRDNHLEDGRTRYRKRNPRNTRKRGGGFGGEEKAKERPVEFAGSCGDR